jgi:hypothetical protein
MRKISLLLIVAIFSLSTFAQVPLVKGEKQLNVGLGLSGIGTPIYVGLDFGTNSDFTLGIEGSFRSYSERVDHISYSHSVFGFAGNGNYHFNKILLIPSEWDFYAGLNVGFLIWSSPSNYNGTHNTGLGLGLQLGGRYFFNKKWGLNLELTGGNSVSGGKFGITVKI